MAELADLISVKDKSAIELFIRCVRKALWLAMLRGQLELGLWISSAILLLAGLINLFFYNISIYLSLIVALLPMVGVVFVAVKKMPTLANAASHADRLFKSKSLMTTATELLYSHKTVCRDFSPWIIQQAAHSAQRWHEQFKQSTAHKQHRFPWAAMGIALVGFFFILQPGVPDKHEVIKTEGNTVTADSKPALLSSLINEIKREENTLQNEALLSSPDELTEQVSSANPPALSNVDTHPQSNQKQAQVEDLSASINKENSPTPPADATQSAEAGDNQSQPKNQRADAGIGTQADTYPSSSLPKDTKNRDIKLVDINLQDGILVSSGGEGMPFNKYQFTDSDKRIKLPSTFASGNTSTAYIVHFSPSQQHYVNAYFKNIHAEK